MTMKNWFGRGIMPLPRIALALGLIALPLAGCSDILEVSDPDIADPGNFTDETALPALHAAALGAFHTAYDGFSGTDEGMILVSGLLADEWISSGTFPTREQIDIRKMENDNGTIQTVSRNIYRARTLAERASDLFAEHGAGTVGHGEVQALAGFTYILFGENYCSGVPFSDELPDGSFQYGAPETTEQILTRALEAGQTALSVAANAREENLARILQGRALVNLGRYADAAAVVASVPTDYQYIIPTSDNSSREYNSTWTMNWSSQRWSVAANEGGSDLDFRAGDPRVGAQATGSAGFDATTPQWNNLKYPSRTAPIPLAQGIEARLIEAEAALAAGNLTEFRTQLNEARSFFDMDELEASDIPTSSDAQVDLLFNERAYGLWLTAHRLGDLRRLVRQYGRDEADVFPSGDYHKSSYGGTYGTDVNLPLTVDERNNPEFSHFDAEAEFCLNRDA